MKKSRTMKKIVAASCAGLLAIAMCIPSVSAAKTFRNFWLDYGYNQGTSRSTWDGGELRYILAQVRRRSDRYVVKYEQVQSYNGITVTVPSTWNYSNYVNDGYSYV